MNDKFEIQNKIEKFVVRVPQSTKKLVVPRWCFAEDGSTIAQTSCFVAFSWPLQSIVYVHLSYFSS